MKQLDGVYPISREDLSALPVKDIGPAVGFYRTVLGFPDLATLRAEVAAWKADRNAAAVRAGHQLTTAHARVRLKRLHPLLEHATSAVAEH